MLAESVLLTCFADVSFDAVLDPHLIASERIVFVV